MSKATADQLNHNLVITILAAYAVGGITWAMKAAEEINVSVEDCKFLVDKFHLAGAMFASSYTPSVPADVVMH